MTRQRMKTTLEEDFSALGIKMNTGRSVKMSGIIEEDKDDSPQEPEKDLDEDNDPFDGEYVTNELFDRIEALPLDDLEEDDIQKVLDGLSEKKIPDTNVDILERAEKIVTALKEAKATRQRRFKGGSTSRKMSFQCPLGQRAVPGMPGHCRPSHIIVGGQGKLAKEARVKEKLKTRKGSIYKQRRKKVEKRRKGLRSEENMSPFAQELLQLSEDISREESKSLRDEIVERIVNIVDFLKEEFNDKTVVDIYEESIASVFDMYEAGRLEEDVMDDEEFIAELNPVLTIISKSINKLDDGELGND
jgi:hypothetical protein